MEETRAPLPLALLVAVLTVALGFFLLAGELRPAADAPAPWAAGPVPTLQPTPALAVPTPPALLPTAPPAVYVEQVEAGGQVTINQTNIDVDVCILARCP